MITESQKWIGFVLFVIVLFIVSIPLIFIFIPYWITVFLTLIWTFRAEKYISIHGGQYSYRRALGNSLIGPFYLYNYYYEAFGTLSLNVIETPEISEIEDNIIDDVVETVVEAA